MPRRTLTLYDLADLVLVVLGFVFLLGAFQHLVSLGWYLSQPDESSLLTPSVWSMLMPALVSLAHLGLGYLLLFRRAEVLRVLLPSAVDVDMKLPDSLTALGSYAFWIRIVGLVLFLHGVTNVLGFILMEWYQAMAHRMDRIGTIFWTNSLRHGVNAIIGFILLRQADRISSLLAVKDGR